jgi:hypothetical protein
MQIYAVFGSDFDANAQATGILSKYGVSGKVGVVHFNEIVIAFPQLSIPVRDKKPKGSWN